MGNALTMQPSQILIEEDDPLLRDYKKATVADYRVAKENFDTLQATVGDKMAVTLDEFDDIFSLICQDAAEHFELFDCWMLGKVDVMEVFAVVIVYCKAPIETKIPLLFDLFDFDHSGEISEYELVLLLLCATRGLCKVIGLDRPSTDELEALATSAFVSIDRDHSGAISLQEFTAWALQDASLLLYVKRFAATRLIYDSQRAYDALLQQLCGSFVQFVVHNGATNAHIAYSPLQHQQLACSARTCKEVIQLHCPATENREVVDYLVRAMVDTMQRRNDVGVEISASQADATASTAADTDAMVASSDAALMHQMVSMDVFCMIVAPYAAFVVADEDKQHVVDAQELVVLLWLLRGKEPTRAVVDSYLQSLDRDANGVLSALEWVTFAIETDARTGSRSVATQLQLLFTHSDRNGDARLSQAELCAGLQAIVLQSLVANKVATVATTDQTVRTLEKQLETHAEAINELIAGLANELMQALDQNATHGIEWFEFRQHLDDVEDRVRTVTTYIKDNVIQ